MADLRLSGWQLRTVRRLATNPITRPILWAATNRDFGIPALKALGASDRAPLDEAPRPIQGAPPRQWGAEPLDPPKSPRCTGRMLREAYASGAATPSSVLDRALGRIEAKDFGPATHSPFIDLDPEVARREAAASTERWAKGQARGVLDGVLVPIKDEFHVKGLPTRGGTTYLTEPAAEDAFLVARLREAGAIPYGKTHATEWGLNPLGYLEHFDMPRNPYRSDRGAGGSSTGSGVAVGLGLATVAVGTDGGCSIRVPALHSGAFGLKPTFIRIGRTGDIWGASTVAHIGPIGQSTEDCVDFMEVAAGTDPDDPTTRWQPDPAQAGWRAALGRGVRGCRIGVLHKELADADAAIAQACLDALVALEREGAVLVDTDIPLVAHAPAVGALVIGSETVANTRDDCERHGDCMSEEFRTICGLLGQVSAQELLMAARTRAALRRQAAKVLAGVDVLALPASARQAPPYALAEGRMPLMDSAWTASMTRFAFFGNLTGLPAATFPVATKDDLPIGLQIMGDAWDEASVIAVMAHCERLGLTDIPKPPAWHSLLEA